MEVSLGEGQLQGKREGLIKTGTSEDQALLDTKFVLLRVQPLKTAFPSWTKVPRSVDLTRRQDQ